MYTVSVLKPEISIDTSDENKEKLIRRIQFIKDFNENTCEPSIPVIGDFYPSSFIENKYDCTTTGKSTEQGFYCTVKTGIDIIKNIRQDLNPDDTLLYHGGKKLCPISLWINFASVVWSSDISREKIKEMVNSKDNNFQLAGYIELYLQFEKCSITDKPVCYAPVHGKVWNIQAGCIHGIIDTSSISTYDFM